MKPVWICKRYSIETISGIEKLMSIKKGLNTICEEALCPNLGECYAAGTATFLIMGKVCTRNCRFCAVKHGVPEKLDKSEPQKLASTVKIMGLKYVVITSVTRDDLDDGGADHFAETIREISYFNESVRIEVLIPDFKGSIESLRKVVDAKPHVIAHNVEMVPRLYKFIRPEADFYRSIEILRTIKILDKNIITKSGFMLGLGERKEEVIELLKILSDAGCDVITIGQYLQPRSDLYPVQRFLSPDEFEDYKEIASKMGFKKVLSGPFVRSSYNAADTFCN